MDGIKFKLEDYIYDDKSLTDFRRRMKHIHSVIRPQDTEVMVCDFKHIKDSESISYWVEHWKDKFSCDYMARFEIPVDFIQKNLSDEGIKAKWLELHPEEVAEVPISGIPKVESGSRTINGSKRKNPGDNEEEFKKIGEKLRQQEWMIKKFVGYAAVTLKAGFFNADHLKQLVSEAKEVLNEQD